MTVYRYLTKSAITDLNDKAIERDYEHAIKEDFVAGLDGSIRYPVIAGEDKDLGVRATVLLDTNQTVGTLDMAVEDFEALPRIDVVLSGDPDYDDGAASPGRQPLSMPPENSTSPTPTLGDPATKFDYDVVLSGDPDYDDGAASPGRQPLSMPPENSTSPTPTLGDPATKFDYDDAEEREHQRGKKLRPPASRVAARIQARRKMSGASEDSDPKTGTTPWSPLASPYTGITPWHDVDEEREGLGGCLGTITLFPGIVALLVAAFIEDSGLWMVGAVLVVFAGLLVVWLRSKEVLKGMLLATAGWIGLGLIGLAVTWGLSELAE